MTDIVTRLENTTVDFMRRQVPFSDLRRALDDIRQVVNEQAQTITRQQARIAELERQADERREYMREIDKLNRLTVD